MADILWDPRNQPDLPATSGGQGSFSYADTTVYGNRGDKSQYFRRVVRYDPNTGVLLSDLLVATTYLTLPGTGGGAKLPGKRYYGSRARGFNPSGAVLIRLFKVE